jgi:hypothetical protein
MNRGQLPMVRPSQLSGPAIERNYKGELAEITRDQPVLLS